MTDRAARARLAAGVFMTLAMAGTGALAQGAPQDRPAALQRLLACRGLAEGPARLACFDAAAAAFDQAESKGDVVVVDREQASRVKRQAFGLSLPSLSLFDRGEAAKPMEEIAAKVKSAYRGGEGRWVVELEDGATWVQTDQENLGRPPRPGSEVRIRRAALGGFMMNLDGQRAVRARRVQ